MFVKETEKMRKERIAIRAVNDDSQVKFEKELKRIQERWNKEKTEILDIQEA